MNDGHEYTVRVPSRADGLSLERFLAEGFRHSTPAQWRARINDGHVTLNGVATTPDTPLRPGQTIRWNRPGWREPDAPLHYRTVHEDDELLVVNKPAGLPTLPGAGYLRHTLYSVVRDTTPDAVPAHRLGRWTSGLVLFARSPRARRALAEQFATGRIRKRYFAVAAGRPRWRRRRIAIPIGPVPHPGLGSVHAACFDGRSALTWVTVRQRRRDEFLCEVEIYTGRPHQIRIHLAAAGHPLSGDPLYRPGGRPEPGTAALPGDPGYRLHAVTLELDHPATGRRLRVTAAPPRGWDQPSAETGSSSRDSWVIAST